MPSEPIASGQAAGEPQGAQASPQDAGRRGDALTAFSADAAYVTAAIDRMQGVLRGERTMLARLHDSLIATVRTVADAKKAMAQPAELAELLEVLHHRLDSLIEMTEAEIASLSAPARSKPRTERPHEPADAVPTVSHVVSRLGRGDDAAARPSADDTSAAVSLLKGMVEALGAEVPPAGPRLPESELIQSVAQLQALPMLMPEPSAAVIFARPTLPAASPLAAPASDAETAVAVVPPAVEAEVPAEPVLELEASAIVEAQPQPAQPAAEEVDRDLSAFLFGPDFDPRPVDRPTLVAPATPPSLPAVDLVQPASVPAEDPQAMPLAEPQASPAEESEASPAAESEDTPAAQTKTVPIEAASPPATAVEHPPDPLAPLNAMSADEKLALFS